MQGKKALRGKGLGGQRYAGTFPRCLLAICPVGGYGLLLSGTQPGVWDAAARLHSKQRCGLFSDTIKRWRRAFVDGGPAENQRPRRRRAHLAFDSRLGVREDAAA
ncbi:unnamed protein product, partial [Gulo gulo]